MAVMADFARLPNQRKVMIFVVAGFLLFLLYYQFVFKSLNEGPRRGEGPARREGRGEPQGRRRTSRRSTSSSRR